MNLKDVEREMQEEENDFFARIAREEESKKQGRMVHLLPAHEDHSDSTTPWRGHATLHFPSKPGVRKNFAGEDVEDFAVNGVEGTRKVATVIGTLGAVKPAITPSVTPDLHIISSFGDTEDGTKMVVVVDTEGKARYMSQSKDGHLGAVEQEWPFWNGRPSTSLFD